MSESDIIGEAPRAPQLELDESPLFVGFKPDGSLRRELRSLEGPDRKYVSESDSTFLRFCRLGDAIYVGKVIEDGLSTDRVEDVKRNVFSILRRLCPETRLPTELEIRPIRTADMKKALD